MKSSLNMIY